MTGPGSNDLCWCGSGRRYKRCHRLTDRQAAGRPVATRPIRPGTISPTRDVPASIPRPDYAETGEPGPMPVSQVRTAAELDALRRAGRAARDVLDEIGLLVRPGVTTDEIDAAAHDACIARGGYPSPLGYHGYPKSLCTSINEVICHGIPDDRQLENGDIVNLDVTIYLDGVHGDCSATYLVGEVDGDSQLLVQVTEECLMRGIEVAKPGNQIRDIGRAIEAHARRFGYGIVRSFVGHGIGPGFHMPPTVFHYDEPSATTRIVPGMAFTVEPMITLGTWDHRLWDDGWTAVTADLSRTAQFEHTVIVTDGGPEIATLPEGVPQPFV